MQDLFDYCAEPLLDLISQELISQEVGEICLGLLSVAVPVIALVFLSGLCAFCLMRF